MVKPSQQLLDAIEHSKQQQADAMDPVDRALAGAKLYDMVCERLAWGVAMECPDLAEDEIAAVVAERVRVMRQED
jgi:hypothetical protein